MSTTFFAASVTVSTAAPTARFVPLAAAPTTFLAPSVAALTTFFAPLVFGRVVVARRLAAAFFAGLLGVLFAALFLVAVFFDALFFAGAFRAAGLFADRLLAADRFAGFFVLRLVVFLAALFVAMCPSSSARAPMLMLCLRDSVAVKAAASARSCG
ncbi:MAG TPA: hypothetical protein VGS57_01130 [Thermoanaerobaculia bacterium]|nr:hypothetical protein [Thermoanaerobaculia bacterium]